MALCAGVLLVSAGSFYYHYAPSTLSLLCDRLPMAVAFMALFSLILDERVMPGHAPHTLFPLLILGIGSAVYWYWTESNGAGDLRPYGLVQFLPMVLIPVILLLFSRSYLNTRYLLSALGLYLLAKVFEHFDGWLYVHSGVFSGHTLKHAVSGVAAFLFLLAVPVNQRQR